MVNVLSMTFFAFHENIEVSQTKSHRSLPNEFHTSRHAVNGMTDFQAGRRTSRGIDKAMQKALKCVQDLGAIRWARVYPCSSFYYLVDTSISSLRLLTKIVLILGLVVNSYLVVHQEAVSHAFAVTATEARESRCILSDGRKKGKLEVTQSTTVLPI